MGSQLIVAAFIVTIRFMMVPLSLQTETEVGTGEINEGSQIQENLRSLFDSIAKNDMKNSYAYRNILEGEAIKGQQAFDKEKGKFRFKRQRNTGKHKEYVRGKLSAVKRDTSSTLIPSGAPSVKSLFDAVTLNDLASVKRILADGLSVTASDYNGETAAHVAAKVGYVAILDYLLSENSSLLSAKDKFGKNILYVATVNDKIEIVKYLVGNCRVDILHKDNIHNHDTVVHLAAREGHMDILKYFLEEIHIDPNVLNEKGESPVFSAAGNKKLPIIVYLVNKHGADLELLDNENRNILFPAAMKGDLTVFQYVLDQKKVKLNINWADKESRTVLHWTALNNLLRITEYIVEQKRAEVNMPDKKKQTPLHLAAQGGHIKLVEYLYQMGADPRLLDEFGKRPIELAKDKKVIQFLEEYPKPR